jgi:hypothetical protein
MTTKEEAVVEAKVRDLSAIQADISAVEAKALAGGMTLDQLMALSKEGSRLKGERDKVAAEGEKGARDGILTDFKALRLAVPRDATIHVTLKREGEKFIISSASIISPSLIDSVYAAIGDELLAKVDAVSSIKGLTVSADGVTLNAPAPRAAASSGNGNGSGAQKRGMTVDGVVYESGASAYKSLFEVDKLPYAMNWEAVAGKIRNKDGKDSHTITE